MRRVDPVRRWPFEWFADKAFRGEALSLTRRALREGWPLSAEDRSGMRSALEDLRDSGVMRARQSRAVGEILAELGACPGSVPPARPIPVPGVRSRTVRDGECFTPARPA